MDEQHLVPISDDEDSHSDSYSSSDGDSSVEVTSTVDECENELVHLSTCLHLGSELNDDNNDQDLEWSQPPSPLSSCSSSSSDIEELSNSEQMTLSTTSLSNNKRKRRPWTVQEKIDVIASYEKNQNKRKIAKEKGCTPAQLRQWIKNKENLLVMYKKKKGTIVFHFFYLYFAFVLLLCI